jgi:hypothetical protein
LGKTVLTYLLTHELSKILKKEATILICCACMADGDIRKIIGVGDDYLSLEDLINLKVSSTDSDMGIKDLMYHSSNIFFIDTAKATPLFVRENAVKNIIMENISPLQYGHSFIDFISIQISFKFMLYKQFLRYIIRRM